MDILTYSLFVFLYFILLALSVRIPIFGIINIPFTLMVMVLAWGGIKYDVIINNTITQNIIVSSQELAFLTSIQIIIQFIVFLYKLKIA